MLLSVVTIFLSVLSAQAQSRTNVLSRLDDPRGQPELTVCSQNLENFGTFADAKRKDPELLEEEYLRRQKNIALRLSRQSCDVIALQEVVGKTAEVAQQALNGLNGVLRQVTGRIFDVRLSDAREPLTRVGYLIARDRAEILNTVTYSSISLPKLTPKQKPAEFLRSPVELQLRVKPLGESAAKTVTLVNFHFKSKADREGDPAQLEWETLRMQMSEGLRRIVENRHAQSFASGETILVVLGDRNSNFDTASAKILEGQLTLQAFQGEAPCRLSKHGLPLCRPDAVKPQRLFSVLTTDPQTRSQSGTYRYNGQSFWLDDILMPAESLRFAWESFESSGDYASGTSNDPAEVSDHALVWVRLNW